MVESFTELIKRFFLIKNTYLKATISLFILAVLINSGLLLFIPGLHPLQYPTIALILTIISYIAGATGSLWAIKYEDRKIKNTNELYLLTSFTGFLFSCGITIYIISKFLIEGSKWHIAAFILSQIVTTAFVAGLALLCGSFIYYHRTKPLKEKLQLPKSQNQ